MKVKSLALKGDPNVGLYTYATNDYVLIGVELTPEHKKELEALFGCPIHTISIAGTNLCGVFLAGNNNCLLVPRIAFPNELAKLDKLNIKYEVFDTHHTCLGNNIVVSDTAGIAHVDFSKEEISFIKKALGLDSLKQKTIAEIETVGSAIVHNSKGGLIHRFATEKEKTDAEKILGVNLELGTVNLGSPLVKSGIATNDNGFIIGNASGGPEMVNADESLRGKDE